MTPFEVIDKIARGDVYVIHVTFPEGLTIVEMAKIFESHGLGTAAAFVAGREGSGADSRTRSGGEGPGRLFVSRKPTRCRASTDAGEAGAADGGAIRDGASRRSCARRPRRAT